MTRGRRLVIRLSMTLAAMVLFVPVLAAQPQSTTQETRGTATVTTEKMSGEVLYVEGNNLVVKMANGQVRTFTNVPDSRKATVDGKELGVRDLQPGTWLTATVTKSVTPITVRTTTVGTGKVWFVNGPARHPDPAERREQGIPRQAGLQVHGRGQAGDRVRVAQGHDGVGAEDRRGADRRDDLRQPGRGHHDAQGCTGGCSGEGGSAGFGIGAGCGTLCSGGSGCRGDFGCRGACEAPEDGQPGSARGPSGIAVRRRLGPRPDVPPLVGRRFGVRSSHGAGLVSPAPHERS